jgi:hypothetical protein
MLPPLAGTAPSGEAMIEYFLMDRLATMTFLGGIANKAQRGG